ncbi:nucleotide exchange factor GrpE [Intrasporangium sp.]|uniref:nucleotide exchange factor GrpE n=1 Tax=Intrasporangium sp. TaxID=1925024 RepID=UPI003463BC3E
MDPEARPEDARPEQARPEDDGSGALESTGPDTAEGAVPGSTEGPGPDLADGAGAAGAPAGPGRGPVYADGGAGASAEPGGEDEYDHAPAAADLAEEDTMAASLLADLQRLQAEYVNYKKRVDRDRELIRVGAVSSVVEALLPVLDDIYFARQAGDLESGPFAAIADKLEETLGRLGIERVGTVGDEFDPNVHEALMHVEAAVPEGATGTTVVQIFQPGYRNGERLVRPARVSVADPA